MAHDHVYGICESKCFVEVKSKADTENALTELDDKITASLSPEVIEITEGTEYVLNCFNDEVMDKGRKILINNTGGNIPLKVRWSGRTTAQTTFYFFGQFNEHFDTRSVSITQGYPLSSAETTWYSLSAGGRYLVELFDCHIGS